MSPASKSNSKFKKGVFFKEADQTYTINPGGVKITITRQQVSECNPIFGDFDSLETSHVSTPLTVNSNGHFGNVDETNNQTADSVSNNGSCSGESEDTKDKTSSHQASRQVLGAHNEKREKNCQQNERKHQCQKERPAQELHEKCSGILMLRKLEALAQQFVEMEFSSELATMAVLLKEGKIEESVARLFKGVEEEQAPNLDRGNLKIDITEELTQLAEMKNKYNRSKQEVERVVVTCEGDIKKAEETLKLQKEEPKHEEIVAHLSTKNVIDINYLKAMRFGVIPMIVPPSSRAKPNQLSSQGGSITFPAEMEARAGWIPTEVRYLRPGSLKDAVVVLRPPNQSQVSSSSRKQNQKQVVPNGCNISSSPLPILPTAVNVAASCHQNNKSNGIKQNWGNGSSNGIAGTSRAISAACSLGLFSGMGSNGSSPSSSSPIDWHIDSSMLELHYTSVDWSLDNSSRSAGKRQNSNYDYHNPNRGLSGGGAPRQTITTTNNMGGGAPRQTITTTNNMDGGGIPQIEVFQDNGEVKRLNGDGESSSWLTSFQEKDLGVFT